jgi:diguanylate cyclase (GGDEF)-like protein/PAS domain S-box-containing protein
MPLQALPQSAQALRVAIDAMPVGVSWANLSDRKILFMNRKFTEIFGYIVTDFADIAGWVEQTYPFAEDRAQVANTWGAFLEARKTPLLAEAPFEIPPIEIRIRCKDGSIKTVLNSGILLPEAGWALATFVDITERKTHELRLHSAEREAAENEAIYRLLLDHSPEMIILSPFDESRRYVSSAVTRITGFTPTEYLSLKPLNTFHPDDRQIALRVLEGLRNGEMHHLIRYRILRKGGDHLWAEAAITGYIDPETRQAAGYIATIRDIQEEVTREEQLTSENRALSEVAALDELTGIANRRAFNRAIATESSRNSRSSRDISLLMIDVDHFKRYNDLYGHLAGDACLRTIAATLRQSVRRESDLAARYGGEEFAILMPSTDLTGVELVATKIVESIRAMRIPHAQSPHRTVTVSVGIASWPAGQAFVPERLIEQADKALYAAKNHGRNRCAIL